MVDVERGKPNIFCVIDIDIFVIKASKPSLWGQRLNVINSNHLSICKRRCTLNWNWFLCINQYEFGSKRRRRQRSNGCLISFVAQQTYQLNLFTNGCGTDSPKERRKIKNQEFTAILGKKNPSPNLHRWVSICIALEEYSK